MSNQLVEGLFLLAFWVPPAAILAGALVLLAPDWSARRVATRRHTVPLTH
jgi:hypothetical protein